MMQAALAFCVKPDKSRPHFALRLYVATPRSPNGGYDICLTTALTCSGVSILGIITPLAPASSARPIRIRSEDSTRTNVGIA